MKLTLLILIIISYLCITIIIKLYYTYFQIPIIQVDQSY